MKEEEIDRLMPYKEYIKKEDIWNIVLTFILLKNSVL